VLGPVLLLLLMLLELLSIYTVRLTYPLCVDIMHS